MEKKFYLIEIATGDEQIAGKGVYEYATKNEAVAAFHSKLGSAMKSDLFTSDLLMVVDSTGQWYEQQYYTKEEK